MDYIGCWNTSQTYSGKHQGCLNKGSVSIESFSIPVNNDVDAMVYAKELAKDKNYYLLSVSELRGSIPPFNIRKIYLHNSI